VVPDDAMLSFGPSIATDRAMVGSDTVAVGYLDGVQAFAIDYYLGGIYPCTEQDGVFSGVCEDNVMGNSNKNSADNVDNVQLHHAHRKDVVLFVRYRRPLISPDKRYDRNLQPHENQTFVWSWSSGSSSPDGLAFKHSVGPTMHYHGYNYGQLDLALAAPLYNVRHFADLDFDPVVPAVEDVTGGFTLLHGGKVRLTWSVNAPSITLTASSTKKSDWLSVAIGKRMASSHAYVAWTDEDGELQLGSYAMSGQAPSSVEAVQEELQDIEISKDEGGRITMSFTRPLQGSGPVPTLNLYEDTPFIWAMGKTWTQPDLQVSDTHSDRSALFVYVNLESGVTKSEKMDTKLAVHGWMMYLAWGVMVPFGIGAARYTNGFKFSWLKLHMGLMYGAVAAMLVGLAFAVAEEWKDGRHFKGTHSRIGIAVIVLGVFNPLNALLRPPKGQDASESQPAPSGLFTMLSKIVDDRRRQWELLHRVVALLGVVLAIAALFTGLGALERHGLDATEDFTIALVAWLVFCVLVFVLMEVFSRYQRSQQHSTPVVPGEPAGQAPDKVGGALA